MASAAVLFSAWQVLSWPPDVPLELDGRLDEPFWQNVPVQEMFFEQSPQSGVPASYRTQVRIARDETFLYIAAVMDDPPDRPRQSHVSRRDNIPANDSSLHLLIDPMGTRSFAQFFQVNPDCSTADGLYNDTSLSLDLSANYFYAVACHQEEKSWSVEFRIPLTEMRFARELTANWNILVKRTLDDDQSRVYANARLPRNPLCELCLAPALEGLGTLPEPSFMRVTPYVLARQAAGETKTQTGADLKWRMNSNAFVDATVNPDFSQIQLDSPQLVANASFAISSPENRPFFLEGSDILSSPLNAIATRSIAQPSWGLKYTERTSNHDTVLITGDDKSDNRILIPGPYGSRFRPIRAEQKYVIGSSSWKDESFNLGLFCTARSYEGLGSNQTLGWDARRYLSGEDSIRWQSILSTSSNAWDGTAMQKISAENGSGHILSYQHKSETWGTSVDLKYISEKFRADLGFAPRRDYQLAILTETYRHILGDAQFVYTATAAHKAELQQRPIERTAILIAELNYKRYSFSLDSYMSQERIQNEGSLHPYRNHSLVLAVSPPGFLTSASCTFTLGGSIDRADDRVRPSRSSSCGLGVTAFQSATWSLNYSEQRLTQDAWNDTKKPVLIDQFYENTIVIPLTAKAFLRYIRQDFLSQRIEEPRDRGHVDSWTLGYENPQFLTVYAGTTQTGSTQEYYLKLSGPLSIY